MSQLIDFTLVRELPGNATNGEALVWLHRMRRLLDRWDSLPDSQTRVISPEVKREVRAVLDQMEVRIGENMLPEGA